MVHLFASPNRAGTHMATAHERRAFGATLAIALAVAIGAPTLRTAAQDEVKQPGERKVEPQKLPLDRNDVWTLHFRYKPPRIMTVDGFDAKGNPAKQIVWYMWYQVYNRSGEPVTFVPEMNRKTLGLTGREKFRLRGLRDGLSVGGRLQLEILREARAAETVPVIVNLATDNEIHILRNGGLLPFLLSEFAAAS